MINKILSIVAIILTFSSFSQINFQNLSIEEAKEKATAENKKIFIDVFTTWCGPCKVIDRDVFKAKEIGDRMNPDYISIKIDAENHPDNLKVRAYGIPGYPTMLIIDGNGIELQRIIGSMPIDQFHRELDKQVPSDKLPQNIALKEMDEHPNDEAIWRKSMFILMNKAETKFLDNCQTFVHLFGLSELTNELDSMIFFNSVLPLDNPIAKRILADETYMPWNQLMYKKLDFRERARTAPTKKEYDAVHDEAKKLYDQLYLDYSGDLEDESSFMNEIFPDDLNPVHLLKKKKVKKAKKKK